jgi:hypothetical protein
VRRPFKVDGILTGSELRGLKKEGLNQVGIFAGEGIERMGKSEGDRRSNKVRLR